MAIQLNNSYRKYLWVACGILISFLGCRENNNNEQNVVAKIVVDSIALSINPKNYIAQANLENGFVFLTEGDSVAVCYVDKISKQIQIVNFLTGRLLSEIQLNKDFLISDEDGARMIMGHIGNEIYCITPQNNLMTKIHFLQSDFSAYDVEYISVPAMKPFSDSLFFSKPAETELLLLSNRVAIPYGNSESTFENLKDKNIFYQLTEKSKNNFESKPVAETPAYFLNHFDMLSKIVAATDDANERYIYTFQKSKTLYTFSPLTNTFDSTSIDNFTTIDQDTTKKGSFTYLRNYMDSNDRNAKLLINKSGKIFLFKINHQGSESKYDIIVYNSNLKRINTLHFNASLNLTLSYAKEEKIFVPNADGRFYYVFQLGSL